MKRKQTHEDYYKKNKKYSDFLENQSNHSFQKYSEFIVRYSKNNSSVLDVGCGTGIAMGLVLQNEKKKRKVVGIEISQDSVVIGRKKGLDCRLYDGEKIPFNNSSFDIVASINVLEHTEDPENFLNEQYRVLKKGGHLIVVCPNFLSITNNYHHHTKGISQKIKNFITILSKLIDSQYDIRKMRTVKRKIIMPDDDACNVTNPLDILNWSKNYSLKLVYWSSQQTNGSKLNEILDRGIFKIFLGSSFFVFKKQ